MKRLYPDTKCAIGPAIENGFYYDFEFSFALSENQLQEIEEGQEKGLDVSYYKNPEFLAIQMREIRLGLEAGVDVSVYADKAYDWFQMKEIRKGLEKKLDVSKYADPKISFEVMHQLRRD